MPELPEVEFAVRKVRGWMLDQTLERISATPGKPLRDTTPTDLQLLIGQRVTAIRRRGKQMFLDFEEHTLLVHLGMTGKWIPREEPARGGTRMRWVLESGAYDFVDWRRFGRVRLLELGGSHPEVDKLGPDALELCADPPAFVARLKGTRAIKVALMDQKVLAGVGNIYAAEALFRAGIHPRREVARVSRKRKLALAGHLRACMVESLEREVDPEIVYLQEAEATNPFEVYGREDQPCLRCARPIRRFDQAGRSTFWCSRCQR